MIAVVTFASVFFVIILIFVLLQVILLFYKNVGLLTFWMLFDYA